jgi:hypothetical protein
MTNTKGLAANERECGEEAEVNDDNEDHEFDEVLAHFLEAWDESSPVRAQTEDGANTRDHEESLERENIKG